MSDPVLVLQIRDEGAEGAKRNSMGLDLTNGIVVVNSLYHRTLPLYTSSDANERF